LIVRQLTLWHAWGIVVVVALLLALKGLFALFGFT
jgi:hypothetical protein